MNFSNFLCRSTSQELLWVRAKDLLLLAWKAFANRRSNQVWWEVQLRMLSSAQPEHAECFSGSCPFHKNSQFPAFPKEEMLKVPSCHVGWRGNRVEREREREEGGPHHFALQSEMRQKLCDTGPHSDLWVVQKYRGISFCSDHIVPVTRTTPHRSRQNTPRSPQLLGRADAFGCLKHASHVDFLIVTCFQSQTQ